MENRPFIDFKGKKVIVTGASSGIGRAISIEISRHGAEVILMGRDKGRLDETAALLNSDKRHLILLDLKEHSLILPKIKEFSKNFGRIYGVCYSAGVDATRPLSSYKADIIRAMLDINLIAGIELCRAVCRRDVMEESGGSILFISSIAGIVGIPGRVGYSASKGGVSAAVRSMAIELSKRNIRVNALSPGLVRTSLTEGALSKLSDKQIQDIENAHPLGIGSPQDVARGAAFLMAPQSSWITGVDMVIDGGYTIK